MEHIARCGDCREVVALALPAERRDGCCSSRKICCRLVKLAGSALGSYHCWNPGCDLGRSGAIPAAARTTSDGRNQSAAGRALACCGKRFEPSPNNSCANGDAPGSGDGGKKAAKRSERIAHGQGTDRWQRVFHCGPALAAPRYHKHRRTTYRRRYRRRPNSCGRAAAFSARCCDRGVFRPDGQGGQGQAGGRANILPPHGAIAVAARRSQSQEGRSAAMEHR